MPYRTEQPEKEESAAPSDAGKPIRSRKKIMVADDDAGVRKLLQHALSSVGFDVCLASNGLEASRQFGAEKPDALITDLAMPDQEGIETMKRFQQQFPGRPTIVISGAFVEPILRSTLYLGASAVMEKPLPIPRLLELVRALVRD